MIYCITNGLGKKLPGIEHSQVNRIKLLNEYQQESKIITLCHNPELYENAKLLSIEEDIFSIYDYFQESIGPKNHVAINYYEKWQKGENYRIEFVKNTTDIKVFFMEDYICYVRFYDKEFQKINYINYFDSPYQNRRKIRREIFDTRGFLSQVKILGGKQKIELESYYNPSGSEKFRIYYNDKKEISRIHLLNYKNEECYFNNKEEWQAFFFDEINQPDTCFFTDRTRFVMDSIKMMKTKKRVYPVFHSIHLRDATDPVGSEITFPYQKIFSNLDQVSGVIASTKQQAFELNERLPEKLKAYPIPVGYSHDIPKRDFSTKNPYKIVCMARYYSEKQLLHQIKVIQSLVPSFPELELHLYGYGDGSDGFKEEKMLKKYVDEHQLDQHVFFRGYVREISSEYEDAGVMLLTSNLEGFCLAMLEAVEHGVPVISYDIRYGPSEIIVDGQNGFLVEKNNMTEMKEKLCYLLAHPEVHQKMSQESYKIAQKFSKDQIIKKWQLLINNDENK